MQFGKDGEKGEIEWECNSSVRDFHGNDFAAARGKAAREMNMRRGQLMYIRREAGEPILKSRWTGE